ncbi:MAG: hypothetical protein D6717_03930 [Gammaproteobacteria bacterium]|nr:MAG: hypothetical protein D6717_03930 [Gammaproteobacteria bacterium]
MGVELAIDELDGRGVAQHRQAAAQVIAERGDERAQGRRFAHQPGAFEPQDLKTEGEQQQDQGQPLPRPRMAGGLRRRPG